MCRYVALTILLAATVFSSATAKTIYIKADGSGDYPTIQAGIFAAGPAAEYGGAIFAYNFGATIRDCTFYDNSAGLGGGAIATLSSNTMLIRRCTMFRNESPAGASMMIVGSPTVTVQEVIMAKGLGPAVDINVNATITCTDIYGHSGGNWTGLLASYLGVDGNFSEDALFCDASSGDFGLGADSPCANNNQLPGSSCTRIGAHNIGCGAVPIEETTWGAVKALYSN